MNFKASVLGVSCVCINIVRVEGWFCLGNAALIGECGRTVGLFRACDAVKDEILDAFEYCLACVFVASAAQYLHKPGRIGRQSLQILADTFMM